MERVACFQGLLLHVPQALLCLSHKVPSKWATLQASQWGPYGKRCLFPEPFFTHPSGSPLRKPPPGSPHRPPIERDALFPEPSFICLSRVPSEQNPHQVPTGPLRRKLSISRTFFYASLGFPIKSSPDRKILPFSRRPWERSIPSMFPQKGPLWINMIISRALLNISFRVSSIAALPPGSHTELPQRKMPHFQSPPSSVSQSLW